MPLAAGRNTGLAILKDAGIPTQPRDPSTETAVRTVDAALVGAPTGLRVRISKLPAAQRCDDDTVTFQPARPALGK